MSKTKLAIRMSELRASMEFFEAFKSGATQVSERRYRPKDLAQSKELLDIARVPYKIDGNEIEIDDSWDQKSKMVTRKIKESSDVDAVLAKIASDFLGLETLEPRHSDRLDFHELSVISLKKALKAAFEAGKNYRHGESVKENDNPHPGAPAYEAALKEFAYRALSAEMESEFQIHKEMQEEEPEEFGSEALTAEEAATAVLENYYSNQIDEGIAESVYEKMHEFKAEFIERFKKDMEAGLVIVENETVTGITWINDLHDLDISDLYDTMSKVAKGAYSVRWVDGGLDSYIFVVPNELNKMTDEELITLAEGE
jgi:hypothetical protein